MTEVTILVTVVIIGILILVSVGLFIYYKTRMGDMLIQNKANKMQAVKVTNITDELQTVNDVDIFPKTTKMLSAVELKHKGEIYDLRPNVDYYVTNLGIRTRVIKNVTFLNKSKHMINFVERTRSGHVGTVIEGIPDKPVTVDFLPYNGGWEVYHFADTSFSHPLMTFHLTTQKIIYSNKN